MLALKTKNTYVCVTSSILLEVSTRVSIKDPLSCSTIASGEADTVDGVLLAVGSVKLRNTKRRNDINFDVMI